MSANRLKLKMEKTEWLWTGTVSNLNRLPKSALQLKLGHDTIDVADAVRVLGVLVTPDLCLDKHVTAVSAKCFFQLRQLRRVQRSLDDESVATLVHAFFTSRIDYFNGLLQLVRRKCRNRQAATCDELSSTHRRQHAEV